MLASLKQVSRYKSDGFWLNKKKRFMIREIPNNYQWKEHNPFRKNAVEFFKIALRLRDPQLFVWGPPKFKRLFLPSTLTVFPQNDNLIWKTVVQYFRSSEAVAQACSVKKVLQASGLQLYFKKGLWHRRFPVNFAKFLRIPFLTEHLRRLLLVHYTPSKKQII